MGRIAVKTAQPIENFFQFSLLGLLASGYMALAGSGYLDLPTIVLTGAGLFLRLLLITGWVRLRIDSRWTNAASLAYIGFYPIDVLYVSREFIPATVHLICFLAVVRVLTATTNRDYFFLKLIAFLELVAATLLSSSINFFLFLTLFVVFGVCTFCSSEIRRSSQSPRRVVLHDFHFHRRLAAIAAGITLGIVVLTAGLFFLLPRTARAAFRTLVAERYHLPGFSTEITLGQIGEFKTQSTPLMHIRIDPPHERAAVKWRGAALTQFDGRRWYNPSGIRENIRVQRLWTLLASDEQRSRHGPRMYYDVRIGRVDSDALFFTGVPEAIQINDTPLILRKGGDSFTTGLGFGDGREYRAISHRPESGPDVEYPVEPLTPQQTAELLLLPPVGDRVIKLAREVGVGATPLDRARAIERYLKTQFGYTTELLKEQAKDPLAHFLFDRRKGHCEYFASAMAVMLRVIHVPSRVATGFQSGTYNPMTGWHVIRASDAHSWVEAWIPGRGWTTFDPTPPDDTQPKGLAALLNRLMLYTDAAETLWHQWVIDYNKDQQIDLVARFGRRSRTFDGAWLSEVLQTLRERAKQSLEAIAPYVPHAIVLLITTGVLAFFAPRIWKHLQARRHAARVARGHVQASDAAILYGRMLETLQRWGLEKPPWLTPGEFARVVPESPRARIVDQITSAYHELRYGGDAEAGRRMVRLLDELESCK